MRRELIIKSKSLGGTSDLTLLAPIRQGLVPSLDTVTHKTRIKRLLQTLGAGRSSSQEYALLRPFSDAVERVGKIHSVRVAVLEPENKVLLAVTFDGSWEAYIRVLWQKVGTLLDIIFFDTEDYVSAYDNRFEDWEAWCRRVQVETHFFYGTPQLTVDDVRYLRHEEECHRRKPYDLQADLAATRYAVQSPEQLSWKAAARTSGQASLETLKQGLEALAVLYRLADLYLPSTEDGLYLQRAARDLLLEFVVMLASDEFPPSLLALAQARFEKQLRWLQKPVPAARNLQRAAPPLPDVLPVFDRSDVQGGIVRAYEGTTHGCMLLLAIADRGKAVAFFDQLIRDTTREDQAVLLAGGVAVNVAFTYEGLREVGLSEAELAMFPAEFREGMEARAGMLGDVRGNHPRRWRLPVLYRSQAAAPERIELVSVHLILQLRVRGEQGTNTLCSSDETYLEAAEFDGWRRWIESQGLTILSVQQMQRNFEDGGIVEHFGFADGGSDPVIDPAPATAAYVNQVRLGEILLGYGNEADSDPDTGRAVDVEEARKRQRWLRNGSFLVVRKLAQDVAALDEALAKTHDKEYVLAKMMGREKNGEALAYPGAPVDERNDFDYRDDPDGSKCPFHAHVRRVNPRRPLGINEPAGRRTPRIARRGMSYGPPVPKDGAEDSATVERGLVFMAYNASIGEQFEVVQRWISGGNSSGGYSGQSDPFLGVPENTGRRSFRFEDDKGQVVSVDLDGSDDALGDRKPFVRLEWGAYLFAPSLSALDQLRNVLAVQKTTIDAPWSADEGELAIARLNSAGATRDDWKAALEDPIEIEKFRSASIWAAIRKNHGGVLRTPYGVLVADRELAMQVLSSERYSVKGYKDRLTKSIGPIYLGQDNGDEYQKLCVPVNKAIQSISKEEAFHLAREQTHSALEDHLSRARRIAANPSQPDRWELILEIREVIDRVLGRICQHWFGLPEETRDICLQGSRWDAEPHRALYPGHFTAPSRYVFQPHPGASAEKFGCDYGATLTSAFSRFIEEQVKPHDIWPLNPKNERAPIGAAIWDAFGPKDDVGLVARTLVGAMMGLLPTVDGNLRRSLNEWLYEGTFWSLRTSWRAAAKLAPTLKNAEKVLERTLIETMQLRPSPELVWRTATDRHRLGDEEVREGDIVVVSVVSAAQQCRAAGNRDTYPLFGGDRSKKPHPTHACPGYEAAMGVMLGFISALLEVEDSVRPSAVPMALTFEGPLQPPPDPQDDTQAQKNRVELALQLKGRPQALRHVRARGPGSPTAMNRSLIIGLGDSWFHYFAIDVFDALQDRPEFEAVSLAEEGIGLISMANNPAQLLRLSKEIDDQLRAGKRPRAILLSAGGNDVVSPQLKELLSDATQGGWNKEAIEEFVDVKMRDALVQVVGNIDAICARQLGESVPIVVHGYDHPYPDGRGPLGTEWSAWLKPDFDSRGYKTNPEIGTERELMQQLIVRLNKMQTNVRDSSFPKLLHHIDLQGTLAEAIGGGDYKAYWGNELHPTPAGFAKLAERLAREMQSILK